MIIENLESENSLIIWMTKPVGIYLHPGRLVQGNFGLCSLLPCLCSASRQSNRYAEDDDHANREKYQITLHCSLLKDHFVWLISSFLSDYLSLYNPPPDK